MFVVDSGSVFAARVSDPARHYALGRNVTIPAVGFGGFGGAGGGGGRGGAAPADSTAPGGALAMKTGPHGAPVVVLASDNKSVFVSGTRAPGAKWETQAPRPWVDRIDLETAKRDRVFESAADAFDEFVAPLDDDYSKIIYTHESPTVIADAFLRDVKTNANTQLTHNKDVAPEVSNAVRKRMVITRPRDGLKFYTDVTLPQGWTPGTKLPGIIWFYPREYTGQAEYDRSRYTTNINKFPAVAPARPASSTQLWVTQGYALIEPDIPIFGDSGKMNDNYTRDLKENLDAVLDAVVDAGYVDRNKMGIGGHSYGAFSTVNALTLTPYFKAGIAGDGMYNRSLTPFGFQSERRDFFQAQSTYLDMSPFYRADKITGALLMYHAMEDQNVGTAPISSQRMYHALQGLGKPAALYMYPYEDHSDATYQSDLDIWARWLAWFDIYVKNAKSAQKTTALVP
ncbi:MAG: prolyl oligopeptidase family serine peptidase [bacterium]